MATDRVDEVGRRVVGAIEKFPLLQNYLELAHQRSQLKKQHIALIALAILAFILLATNVITYNHSV